MTKIQKNWREIEDKQRETDEILDKIEEIAARKAAAEKVANEVAAIKAAEEAASKKAAEEAAALKAAVETAAKKASEEAAAIKAAEKAAAKKVAEAAAMKAVEEAAAIIAAAKKAAEEAAAKKTAEEAAAKKDAEEAAAKENADDALSRKAAEDATPKKTKVKKDSFKDDQEVRTYNEYEEKRRKRVQKIFYKTLCWNCSCTNVKLFTCGGCLYAKYCSKICLTEDWSEHGNYCIKIQQKLKWKKFEKHLDRVD